ncbi:hypothetical protein FB451DRAFT_1264685 [Mycena latifolia]|nr:hypothetical protein FB451DRAFT_1264685 [Mycena latifolia]
MGTDDFLRICVVAFRFACILVQSSAFSRCALGHLTLAAIQSSLVPEGSWSPPQLQRSRNVDYLLIATAALT